MSRLNLLIVILASCSCGNFSQHENFKAHMLSVVGKNFSDGPLWVREDRYVSASLLENGNTENKYIYRKSCFYFFEVEKETNVIVGWRFEGSVKDCQIPL